MLLSNTRRQMTMTTIQRAGESDLSMTTIPSYTNQATTISGKMVKMESALPMFYYFPFPFLIKGDKNND